MGSTHVRFLLTEAYRILNSNAKWQRQSDDAVLKLGLRECQQVPQLLSKRESGKLILFAPRIVDDVKAAAVYDNDKNFIESFGLIFNLVQIHVLLHVLDALELIQFNMMI